MPPCRRAGWILACVRWLHVKFRTNFAKFISLALRFPRRFPTESVFEKWLKRLGNIQHHLCVAGGGAAAASTALTVHTTFSNQLAVTGAFNHPSIQDMSEGALHR